MAAPPLPTVLREWGRIGWLGFGGPPAHMALLRELCVERRGYLSAEEFEDAIAACNLLPGPASTQLAVFTAWRVRGAAGALTGGLAFVLPGLLVMVGLAAVFLASAPPDWIRGAGEGAGAAVAAVAVRTGLSLVPASRARGGGVRWFAYALAGGAVAVLAGPWVVLALLACGLAEVARRRAGRRAETAAWAGPALAHAAAAAHEGTGTAAPWRPLAAAARAAPWRPLAAAARAAPWRTLAAAAAAAPAGALAWTAFKVGALSYGGGFVIVPLMQGDAVSRHHWMTGTQFLSAVALGQVTPGPVTHTVSAVGYAAAGVPGALLAAAVAFAPSFAFVLLGGPWFDRLRGNAAARAFLDGAGPAAIGAILGSAVPLARQLTHPWQAVISAVAAAALLIARRPIVETLVLAGVAGALIAIS